MVQRKRRGAYLLISLVLVTGLLLTVMPEPAFSQQNSPEPDIQNLVVNGGFEQGFQEDYGVAYNWGGFRNGSAAVGFNSETWDKAVVSGQYAQFIEIKNATDRDRYAGIYQTIPVVPGQQYKLTINGLIRSEEGDIQVSDHGYRLQYAIDYEGGATWELVDPDQWVELPWDEQPLYQAPDDAYRFDSFETTITARSDRLTLFIRGWKKWINSGSGIYNLDEISLVGPAPANFQAPVAQAAVVERSDQAGVADVMADTSVLDTELEGAASPEQPEAGLAPRVKVVTEGGLSPQETEAPLPVSGRGRDDSVNYILIAAVILLLALLGNAIIATTRRRNPIE